MDLFEDFRSDLMPTEIRKRTITHESRVMLNASAHCLVKRKCVRVSFNM